jgi:hypothetical protein
MPHVAVATPAGPDAAPHRDSFGGYPFLPRGVAWPVCPASGQPMVLFFQFDVRPEFGLALAPGSHVAVFMSAATNEIPTFDFPGHGATLEDRHWKARLDHFKAYVFGPGADLVAQPSADPYLVHQTLSFTEEEKPRDPFFVVGGAPRWYQDPEEHPGFSFVCQLSENFEFPQQPSAAEQPSSFSSEAYCLFLGNSVYLFARPEPVHAEEVWIVVQN